jgi:hypothetical protein
MSHLQYTVEIHAQLEKRQFGCLQFLSVNFKLEKLESKNLFCLQSEISRQINDIRDTGPDTENTDDSPDIYFYGPLVNQ